MAALCGLLLASCADDFPVGETVDDSDFGLPAKVSLSFSAGVMPSVSRADMAEGRDSEINSLWLAFFDEAGNKAYEFTWNDKSYLSNGKLEVEMLSGRYRLAAVANPENNEGYNSRTSESAPLINLLKATDTYNDYRDIAVGVDAGFIDTPTGNLVMQGVWVPDASDSKSLEESNTVAALAEEFLTIHSSVTSVALGGKIHFRRTISQIKLNISYSDKILEFEPISIQVSNVPMIAWLAERNDSDPHSINAGDQLTAHLGNSASFTGNFHDSPVIYPSQFSKQGNTYSFDWYQMENRRSGSCDSYSMRELEDKDASSGANSGIYTALNRYASGAQAAAANQAATYLTFNVRMVMRDNGTMPDGSAAVSRSVVAKYTVHLGYCEGSSEADKAKDFNCRRNHKYTYNIRINDIDKIEVEARREDQQYENGAEGVVSVISNEMMEADAHFSVFNIQLTEQELAGLNWAVRAYYSSSQYHDISNENYTSFDPMYYNWIEFRSTSDKSTIAEYKPRTGAYADGKTYTIDQMANLSEKSASGWYTVFLNEYIYESDGKGITTPTWKSYVNLPDRQVWLKVQEERSADGESVIFGSKYAIRQHSIQTYYGVGSNDPTSAMGIEHFNELEGLHMSYSYASDNSNSDSRYLTWKAITDGSTNTAWNRYLSNSFQIVNGATKGVPMYQEMEGNTATYYTSRACLNRNRDLNGNGVIDREEMRWFLPSDKQYVRIVIGSPGLATPVYDFSKYTAGVDATELKHFAAINNSMLWAEEGMSTGNVNDAKPQHLRCVRYLGVDMSQMSSNPGQPAFEKRSGENIIDFYYPTEALRRSTTSPLPVHRVNSEYNRPAKAFEYRPTNDEFTISLWYNNTIGENLSLDGWIKNLNSHNPCDRFNVNGETGWRVPNQAEMAAMLFCDLTRAPINNTTYQYTTCTQSYFTIKSLPRMMGVIGGSHATAMDDWTFVSSYVKCVRDIVN